MSAPRLVAARDALRRSGLAETAVAETRTRVLSEPSSPRGSAIWIKGAFAIAALGAVATLVGTGLRNRPAPSLAAPSVLTFEVDGVRGQTGNVLRAGAATRSLHFSDGSQIDLETESSVVVSSVDARGGDVRLERGSLIGSFHHRPDTRWTIRAGDVVVEVTGTRFAVTWNAATEAFVLRMEEGSVRLRGCGLDGSTAKAGDVVRTSCAHADSPAQPPPVEVASPKARRSPRSLPAQTPSKPEEHVVEKSLPALLVEADRARHRADAAGAYAALLEIRQRFPTDPAAAQAAFDLAIVEMDMEKQPRNASTWLERYLDEAPRGPLRREALGRLVEALELSHNPSVVDVAASYLRAYPEGPHAATARRIVSRSNTP